MASKHVEFFRMTGDQARGLFRHQLNRRWGHAIARGLSRLILDRPRDYTGPKDDSIGPRHQGVSEANEQFEYFSPAHSGRGSAQEYATEHFPSLLTVCELVWPLGSSKIPNSK